MEQSPIQVLTKLNVAYFSDYMRSRCALACYLLLWLYIAVLVGLQVSKQNKSEFSPSALETYAVLIRAQLKISPPLSLSLN